MVNAAFAERFRLFRDSEAAIDFGGSATKAVGVKATWAAGTGGASAAGAGIPCAGMAGC